MLGLPSSFCILAVAGIILSVWVGLIAPSKIWSLIFGNISVAHVVLVILVSATHVSVYSQIWVTIYLTQILLASIAGAAFLELYSRAETPSIREAYQIRVSQQ